MAAAVHVLVHGGIKVGESVLGKHIEAMTVVLEGKRLEACLHCTVVGHCKVLIYN